MSDTERPIKKVPNYHGHPPYFYIFITLIGLMIATIILGFWEHNTYVIYAVYAIAVFKAYLVMFKFMHLSWEPKMVFVWIVGAVFSLGIFIAGTAVDFLSPREPVKILWMQANTPSGSELISHPKGWDVPASKEKKVDH